MHQENTKIYVWPPRCPVGGPWGPQDQKNAAPGYPNTSPGYQNDKLLNTMGNLRVGGMRRQPGKFYTAVDKPLCGPLAGAGKSPGAI